MKRPTVISILVLCSVLTAVLVAPAVAQNPNLGTAGAQFLKVPVGGRASAMGGAVIANIRDASALFWNPAGITGVRSNDFSFSHTSLWASIALSHAAFVHTIDDVGSFGAAVSVLTMDDMDVTTEEQPEGTGETFGAQDLMIGASFARNLTEDFSVGATIKYVEQRIWHESASGVAFDIGTQYRIGFRDLTLAMSVMHFGGDLVYSGTDLNVKYDPNSQIPYNRLTPSTLTAEDFPLPLHFQVGLSMTAISTDEMTLMLATDVAHPNDNDERVNVGGELSLLNTLFLRGGYRFGYDTERTTLGAGVRTALGSASVSFDYAYAVFAMLPDIHRFSVGLAF
jgi:hypothetical protein